jgi:2'-5' RNA ligase
VDVHEKTGALKSLQEGVDKALAEKLGVAREGRAFVPHITLGRVKRPTGVPTVDEMSETVKDQDCGLVEVTSIVLMKSDLRPQGPIYTPLHMFALAGE